MKKARDIISVVSRGLLTRRLAMLSLLAWSGTCVLAQTPDSLSISPVSETSVSEASVPEKPVSDVTLSASQPRPGFFKRFMDAFDAIDSNYVEPIEYNYTAMLQATRNLEYYTIGDHESDARLAFAEKNNLRIGPYFGWRWIFLGYTFDVLNLRRKNRGINLDLSLYTSRLGFDLFYHRTGENFYFRKIEGFGDLVKGLEGEACNDYITTQLIGAKIYYNFNSKRYANQAIYSQSKIQRRSAGSFQLGVSFTLHDVRFNYNELPSLLSQEALEQQSIQALERIKYTDYAIHLGYAYNWAFARNWCLGMSLMPAISVTWTSTKTAMLQSKAQEEEGHEDSPFFTKIYDSFRRQAGLGLDCTARSGIIYNTGKWFAGLMGIVHNFNYRRNDMRFSNTFGTANVFVGFYFQKRKTKSPEVKAVPPELPLRREQPVVEN